MCIFVEYLTALKFLLPILHSSRNFLGADTCRIHGFGSEWIYERMPGKKNWKESKQIIQFVSYQNEWIVLKLTSVSFSNQVKLTRNIRLFIKK